MEIIIVNQSKEKNWSRYHQDFEKIVQRAESLLQIGESTCASVVFVTPSMIRSINKEYRNIDKATDVISFALKDMDSDYDSPEENKELGDIFINVEAIRLQAKEYGHSIRREVCFLFTHGLLHLLGYDHMNEQEEKKMFELQDVILDEIVPKKNM